VNPLDGAVDGGRDNVITGWLFPPTPGPPMLTCMPDDLVRFRDPEIAALATSMTARLPELADQLAERIRQAVDAYGPRAVVPYEDLRTSTRDHLEFLFGQLAQPGQVDLTVPRATGRRRADQGAPLAAILDAYRLGSRFIWDSLVDEARRSGHGSNEALIGGASDIWALTDAYTEAMISAYRDAVAEQLLRRQQERSAFVEALLSGRLTDTTTLWEAANVLRLPYQGPFVVVAAEVPELGREALPGVEDRLAALGLGSVWRLSPDLQLGVTSLRGGSALERLISVLRGAAAARVGVSPVYTDLVETPRMLHFARVALASSPPGSNGVALFDDAPLSVVIASAPDTATRITRTILGPLLDLPRDERGVLVDTLATWFTSGGSAARTAQKLYCHANTVRHRLHRIEQQTGRSLDDPNAVAELRVALETIRWLPQPDD
jgi:PucR C-terminal helix-turn-helix domain/GGDEF-like domain